MVNREQIRLSLSLALFAATPLHSVTATATGEPLEEHFASHHRYPETVALLYGVGLNLVKCSGTLITPYTVLTAAHCVCGNLPVVVYLGGNVYPAMGADVGYEERHGVKDVQVYADHFCEKYAAGDNPASMYPDLALVHTYTPFEIPSAMFAPLAKAIWAEPSGGSQATQFVVYGAGFGLGDNSDYPGAKLAYRATVQLCTEQIRSTTGCLPGMELTTVDGSDTDTCNGDSGGPIFTRIGSSMNVIGITSRARRDGRLICGDGGVFVLLTGEAVGRWIAENAR